MPTISPCLWFDGQAEEAAAFYTGLLPDSSITGTVRYPEAVDNPGEKPRGSVMTVEFEVAGVPFTALNGGPLFTPNPSISFILNFDPAQGPRARENLEATWEALSDGGSPLMPLDEYPFSDLYGWVQDRFGGSWQVVSTSFVEMMKAGEAGYERVFKAMLDMKKLDIEALETAYQGGPEHPAPEA